MALSIKLKEKINKVAKEKKLVWMVAPFGLHYMHISV
jgi:hypothetical protein